MNTTKIKEKTGQTIFTVAAVICVIAVAAIFVFMLIKSIPALNKIGLFDFIFGQKLGRGSGFAGIFSAGSALRRQLELAENHSVPAAGNGGQLVDRPP